MLTIQEHPNKRSRISFEEIIGLYTGAMDCSIIDSILTYVYKLKNEYPESDGNSNYGGWQKDLINLLDQEHPLKKAIKSEFKEYLKHYCIEEPTYLDFTNLFCNINPPGSSNVMHHHQVGEFSGSLWIQAEENSGQLLIMNPFYNRFINTCAVPKGGFGSDHFKFSKDYNAIHIDPEPNKGVFFNSNLVHYVDINRSQKDRISIAYNIGIHY
jgi:uncharacterized protein (TIGR02466 family)